MTTGGSKSFGPVLNLEEHVQPDWWRRIFNSIYLKTDADVVSDQLVTRKEVDLFSEIIGLSRDDKILDLCCGQGRHSLELASRGFQYVEGLDRSHYLIQKAKAQAKKDGLNVRFREGDARNLRHLPDTFDVVIILGNSFGYFETIEDDLRVLKEVFRVLKPWGRLLIDVADGEHLREQFQPRSWEWIGKKHLVCRERSLSLDKQRLISREVVTHVEKGVIVDQFYAERLYTRESLGELLTTVGFRDIGTHGTISPELQRNQDLGMMERRIIVTATVRKEWASLRRKKHLMRNVGVILGDPRKPDALYHDLVKLKGKVNLVFNLCDEGYGNDAGQELHVPAMLEVLDIPYTGARPQCLAFCYDKSLVRGIAREMGIPVPEAFFTEPEDTTFEVPFGFPAIVKPNFGDSSFGITQKSVANSPEELLNVIFEMREKFGYDNLILVEELLTGSDLSVGIIGNPPESYTALPIIEEDYSLLPHGLPRICGYEAKWLPDSPYWKIKSIRADLPNDTEKCIVEWCVGLFQRLGCRDYARFDWRLDAEGNPKLLEVNPNPGWCWDGHLAKMAKIAQMSYKEMLEAILAAAEQRMNTQMMHEKREEYAVGTVPGTV